jgi:hypothetical protein
MIHVGMKVGAERWPYHAAHPGCWGKPWEGVVLAVDDPRAWTDTLAFPGRTPTQEEVSAHVARFTFTGRTPVLWDFGPHGLKAHWERTESLRPYGEDLAAWEAERAERLASYEAPASGVRARAA